MKLKDPTICWAELIKDTQRYIDEYGTCISRIKGIIKILGNDSLAEWTFPLIDDKALLISRFENYKDKMSGSHVRIKYEQSCSMYIIRYYLNESIMAEEEQIKSENAIEINRIRMWLNMPLIDGINV
jgi:hypothetical protein